jgi:hypothetical protein
VQEYPKFSTRLVCCSWSAAVGRRQRLHSECSIDRPITEVFTGVDFFSLHMHRRSHHNWHRAHDIQTQQASQHWTVPSASQHHYARARRRENITHRKSSESAAKPAVCAERGVQGLPICSLRPLSEVYLRGRLLSSSGLMLLPRSRRTCRAQSTCCFRTGALKELASDMESWHDVGRVQRALVAFTPLLHGSPAAIRLQGETSSPKPSSGCTCLDSRLQCRRNTAAVPTKHRFLEAAAAVSLTSRGHKQCIVC